MDVDEVHHAPRQHSPVHQPVGEVTRRASEHHPQPHRGGLPRQREGRDHDHAAHQDGGAEEQPRGPSEQPECAAAIGGEAEVEDAPDQGDRGPTLEGVCGPRLGQTIGH